MCSPPPSCARAWRRCARLYGEFGYIDFVPEPPISSDPRHRQDRSHLTADEGKQFFVRRIDFSGNTTTRDKVIRREILLDEGDMFNSQPVGSQHSAPEPARLFRSAERRTKRPTSNATSATNTVDITLKVRERGKNSIGLNGGVSGIAGSFIGFNYSTNNFLGLGETLSLESQLGTRMRSSSWASPSLTSSTTRSRSGSRSSPDAIRFRPGSRSVDSQPGRT